MILALTAFLIFLVHFIHSLTLDRKIEYSENIISSKKIEKALDGYKVTFISDVHNMSKEEYREVIVNINKNIQPDILLLGGDYMPKDRVAEFCEVSAEATGKDGIFAVAGNHDRASSLDWATKKNNITFLKNTGVLIKENLFLAGVEDYWKGKSCVKAALEGSREEDFVILLSHNPDVIMDDGMITSMKKVDYTISGHTHGGHVAFFGKFRPALSRVTRYKNLFAGGEVETKNGNLVYVGRGTGYYDLVPRVFSRPEVATFTFKKIY